MTHVCGHQQQHAGICGKFDRFFFAVRFRISTWKNQVAKKIQTEKGGDAAEQRFRYFQNKSYDKQAEDQKVGRKQEKALAFYDCCCGLHEKEINSYDYNINSNNVEQERPRRHSTGNARCYATAMDHPYIKRSRSAHTEPARRRTNSNSNNNNISNNLKQSRSVPHCKRDPRNFYSGRVHQFSGF